MPTTLNARDQPPAEVSDQRVSGLTGAVQQAVLSSAWQGDTGITYQGWQTQWNQALEDLVRAYQSMSGTHESNTMAMLARDGAEAAKWGG
ncbi:WXG100 family type VII secretion target [Mycobacterium tuberculosis]|uniref:WXG100 family type VII secretion target n=5 Tax=Mycobacterium tuberculosis TaxID=1773 RepID=UPI0009972C3D|nr:WXG100 family type VII secretion target [Mycobacterium tuberculosis]